MGTAKLPPQLRAEIASQAANTRLAYMTPDEQAAMTSAATAAREAKLLERLKAEVDPDGQLSNEERTRRATYLRAARLAKYRADLERRKARQRRLNTLDQELDLAQAHAS